MRHTAISSDSFVLCDESALERKVVTMEKSRTAEPGPLGKLRAWLGGDRFMVELPRETRQQDRMPGSSTPTIGLEVEP